MMRQLMEDPNRPLTPAPARATTPLPAPAAPANLDPDFIRQAIQDAIGAFPVIEFLFYLFAISGKTFLLIPTLSYYYLNSYLNVSSYLF